MSCVDSVAGSVAVTMGEPIDSESVASSAFAEATAVSRVSATGFVGTVADGWDIFGNANGGYLLAIAARAMAVVAGRPPLTITAHYLAPAGVGPCQIDVSEIRRGRRFVTLSAALSMGDRQILQVLGTFGDQAPPSPDVPFHVAAAPPSLDPWDDSRPSASGEPDPSSPLPAMMHQLDLRLRPADVGFSQGEKSGRAEIAGWFALADHGPLDEIGLLLAADAFAPAIFNLDLPVAWAPTVELTVHIRGIPVEGPLRCTFSTRFLHGGMLEEDGEIWDSADNLVALSRQLALSPRS